MLFRPEVVTGKKSGFVFLRLLSTHADRQGVDISFTVCLCMCVCVFLFVGLRISPPSIKLAASNFSRRFIGVLGRESPIFVNVATPEAQNRTNRPARGPRSPRYNVNITVQMRRRKRHARDAPFVEYRAAGGRRIGLCGYRSVPTDVYSFCLMVYCLTDACSRCVRFRFFSILSHEIGWEEIIYFVSGGA